jgi:hypothetical protein
LLIDLPINALDPENLWIALMSDILFGMCIVSAFARDFFDSSSAWGWESKIRSV